MVAYSGKRCCEDVEANPKITKYLVESNPFSNLPRKLFLLYAPFKVLYQVRSVPPFHSRSSSCSISSFSRLPVPISISCRILPVFQHSSWCGLLLASSAPASSSTGTTLGIRSWRFPWDPITSVDSCFFLHCSGAHRKVGRALLWPIE